jgi:integrase
VPIVRRLERMLRAHAKATVRGGNDLVFGRSGDDPFIPSAGAGAEGGKAQDPALNPIGLHECRHTFASLMIAAGANAKALSVVMGHASIQITFDRYGKLMPGGEAEVGRLLSVYLNGHG